MISSRGTLTLALLVTGACADQGGAARTLPGNEELGIAEFQLTESPTNTTLVGVDENGHEVARLDLVHGRFTLTGSFREDYTTPDVDGRQLAIVVRGEKLHWETAGYEPVRELPAPPESQWEINTFVMDPVVKLTLDRWQIGFDAGAALDGEAAYVTGSIRGGSPQTCNSATGCGTAYYGNVNLCGGTGGPLSYNAARVTQVAGTNCGLYTSSYNQVVVSQCCPPVSGVSDTNWYGQKACPTTSSNSTSCGTRTSGACKGCPEYPTDSRTYCTNTVAATVGSCGSAVYPLNYQWVACQPNCGQLSQCWQDDGCGGVCTDYGGCFPGQGCQEYNFCP